GVSESTYLDLLAYIPSAKPLVGRACIIAGYDELYSELELEADASYILEALAQGNSDLASRPTAERPQDWLKTRMDDLNGKLMPEAKALGSRGCYSIVTYPRTLYRARILKRLWLELKIISSEDIGSIGGVYCRTAKLCSVYEASAMADKMFNQQNLQPTLANWIANMD
ncbi:hypothetical protein HDU83_008851, partial [Entophlyctis luteolus]